MHNDVMDFFSLCVIFQQTKYLPKPPFGLLQPISPPSDVWEDIAIDFIVSLPTHWGHTVIFIMVDRFSKAATFSSLPTNFSACKTAELFTEMMGKLYSYPKSIISNRDPIFISVFGKHCFLT